MSIFKKTLSLVLLFSLGSMNPRAMKNATASPVRTTPQPIVAAQKPIAIQQQQQPVIQSQSYAGALNIIRTQMPSNKVVINNTLAPEFINFVKSLNLSDIQTQALLEAGINLHATLINNNQKDTQTLLTLKNSALATVQPAPIHQTKQPIPAKPIPQPAPAPQFTPVKPIQQPAPAALPPVQPVVKAEALKPIIPTQQPTPSIIPAPSIKPIAEIPTIKTKDKVFENLVGKVKKLDGHVEIYTGAGISANGEQIFFGMEKLDKERIKVWKKYISALFMDYHNQVVRRLYSLNNNCKTGNRSNIAALASFNYDDPYNKNLIETMCANQKKFSLLFGVDEGIGTGIVGFDQMLELYVDHQDVIYVAYASNEPITGAFKPKHEINPQSFTLEEFEKAYSNLIICVCIDMKQKLKQPVTTEHRGIFKNPFDEIRNRYRNIGLKLHGWAGTVELEFFNKKYMTLFPTPHAGRLLHNAIKKDGGLYLGTDKKPFRYEYYYEDAAEIPAIKEKFPTLKQELIDDTRRTSLSGLEDLHVFDLTYLSKYYTNK